MVNLGTTLSHLKPADKLSFIADLIRKSGLRKFMWADYEITSRPHFFNRRKFVIRAYTKNSWDLCRVLHISFKSVPMYEIELALEAILSK